LSGVKAEAKPWRIEGREGKESKNPLALAELSRWQCGRDEDW
jgi:hypothetical protein